MELKNCPFCGEKAEFVYDGDPDGDHHSFRIMCTGCAARGGPVYKNGKIYEVHDEIKSGAAEIWNQRAPQPTDSKRATAMVKAKSEFDKAFHEAHQTT